MLVVQVAAEQVTFTVVPLQEQFIAQTVRPSIQNIPPAAVLIFQCSVATTAALPVSSLYRVLIPRTKPIHEPWPTAMVHT